MDIWNWVEKLRADLREAGQEQSARLIDELTAYVCDLEVAVSYTHLTLPTILRV